MKKIIMLVVLSLLLSSCFWDKQDDNSQNNLEKKIVSKNKENWKKIDNKNWKIEKNKILKSDEVFENKIKENISRNIEKAKKINIKELSQKIQKCWNKKTCIKIEIENAWEKAKDIKICSFLWDKKEISNCEQRIVSSLVSRELNPKYCDLLKEDFQKQ